MAYHFDSAIADIEAYNEAYNQLMVAALGETTGPAVLDYIQTERNSGHTSFDKTGATDSGNTYTVKYRDGLVSLAVVCSEVDPTASSAQEQAAEEAAQEAPQEETPVSSVIVAGMHSKFFIHKKPGSVTETSCPVFLHCIFFFLPLCY